MARPLKLIALFGWLLAASCTSSPSSVGQSQQAIIECNGGSVGLACDTDDNPCTQELCVQVGQDVNCELQTLAADGTPCLSDGNACTADTCQRGLCENTALPVDTLCDDGLFCTTGSTCDAAGICGAGSPSCDDSNACTDDLCDEAGNTCDNVALAPGANCDDQNACTDTSTCNAGGACIGSDPVDCNDGSECTADSCDVALGCLNEILEDSPCSDAFFCTIAEACTIDGNCEGEANCSDSNPCTVDSCDELGDACANVITPNELCDDGNECTESDSCDALGGCSGAPVANGTSCGSAGGCLAGGTCTDGSCVGGVPLPDNTSCDDNSVCTDTDTCTGGACGGYPINCFDGDPCTADGCDEVTGCFNLVIEGCNIGPDAGPVDAGPGDAGPGEDDAGVGLDAGPDGILGGGGCSSGGSRSQHTALFFLLVLAFGLRRRKRRLVSAVAILAIASSSQTAQAQGFDTEIFKPGTSSTSFLSQESPQVLPSWTMNLGVSLNLVSDPLVLRDPDTGDAIMNGVVVSDRRGAYLTAGVGLFGRLEVGIALPMVLSQDGQGNLLENSPDLNSASLGDVRLTAKAALWRKGNMRLAAALAASLPAGNSDELYGEQGVSAAPQLIAGWQRGRASIALNLGAHFRETTVESDLAIGDELTAGAGAQVELLHRRAWLLAEAYTRSALTEATAENSPAEALVGLRATVWGPYQVQAAVGAGLGRGYGAPAFRGLFGVFYRPQAAAKALSPAPVPKAVVAKAPPKPETKPEPQDSDSDGILDPDDGCPTEPEDIDTFEDADGCPDPDNDRDGILDADDACPLLAEIVNGINDEDGCPDEGIITMVEDRVVLGETVLFDKNRARVKRKGRKALRAIITLYLQHPEWGQMSVEGHADTRGPEDFNMNLSRRRADRVRHEMIDLGMPADKITSKGLGETVPLVEGESEEARQTNRRVEFVIRKVRQEVEERLLLPAGPAEAPAAP